MMIGACLELAERPRMMLADELRTFDSSDFVFLQKNEGFLGPIFFVSKKNHQQIAGN